MFEFDGQLPIKLCPACQKERDSQFQAVHELVQTHRGITAIEINRITGVPMDAILKYIKKGMFEIHPIAGNDETIEERFQRVSR
jgi:NMD protein affecting ribosome stability and mRNA decay